ncbi:MAG TPA: lysophospholipid acyltransferase family protein [Longimicrobiales bacterium]|nr:lysophospholipid acyltransferase family protein [Longimicrobiales bacterium]
MAPTHQSFADPWLLAGALTQRQWRALLPVRTLATLRFDRLRMLTPLIRAMYWLVGAVALPPSRDGGSLPRKVRGLLRALDHGDPVAIFPEGRVRRKGEPPIGEFAPGVVHLHRVSQAPVVPIAVWLGDARRVRRRYQVKVGAPLCIPEALDLVSAAAWLREQTLHLYAAAEQIT